MDRMRSRLSVTSTSGLHVKLSQPHVHLWIACEAFSDSPPPDRMVSLTSTYGSHTKPSQRHLHLWIACEAHLHLWIACEAVLASHPPLVHAKLSQSHVHLWIACEAVLASRPALDRM
jgi:hypothetical protein